MKTRIISISRVSTLNKIYNDNDDRNMYSIIIYLLVFLRNFRRPDKLRFLLGINNIGETFAQDRYLIYQYA